MTPHNSGRGRPKGDGVDDSARLARVADALVANPALSPSAAMRRTDPAPNQSDLRRLQAKWKRRKDELLQAAEARASAKQERDAHAYRSSGSQSHGLSLNTYMDRGDRVGLIVRGRDTSLLGRYLDAMDNSPLAKIAKGLEDSPTARLMKQIENSPTMSLVRALEDSPTMRLVRAMENNPATRLARQMDQFRLRGW